MTLEIFVTEKKEAKVKIEKEMRYLLICQVMRMLCLIHVNADVNRAVSG